MPVDLSKSGDAALRRLYAAYQRGLPAYLQAHRPYWSSKLGIRSGTLVNLEQGISWLATLGHSSLKAGCAELQNITYQTLTAANPSGSGWVVARWRAGNEVMGHSAVAVYPGGGSPEQGYVFDPWARQGPDVYAYAEWEKMFYLLSSTMGAPHRQ
jgi:hypothetical protein